MSGREGCVRDFLDRECHRQRNRREREREREMEMEVAFYKKKRHPMGNKIQRRGELITA